MFEERARTYKEGLAERIEPQLGKGERVQAVAVTQVGLPPWLQTPPLVVGIVLIVVSVIVGSLPSWVGIAGALLVLAGIATMAMVPRRLLARTNRSVHVFELPRSQRATIAAPRASLRAGGAAEPERRIGEAGRRAALGQLRQRDRARRDGRGPGAGVASGGLTDRSCDFAALRRINARPLLWVARPRGGERKADRPPAGAVSLGWDAHELGAPK